MTHIKTLETRRHRIEELLRDLEYADPLHAVLTAADRIATRQWLDAHAQRERLRAAETEHEAAIYRAIEEAV